MRAVQFVRQPQTTTTSICQKMTNAFKSRRHYDRIPSGLEGSVRDKPHFNNFNSVQLIRFFVWKACMTLTPCVLRWREEIMDIKCMRRWNCTCRFVHHFQYIFRQYRQCFAKTHKPPKTCYQKPRISQAKIQRNSSDSSLANLIKILAVDKPFTLPILRFCYAEKMQ